MENCDHQELIDRLNRDIVFLKQKNTSLINELRFCESLLVPIAFNKSFDERTIKLSFDSKLVKNNSMNILELLHVRLDAIFNTYLRGLGL